VCHVNCTLDLFSIFSLTCGELIQVRVDVARFYPSEVPVDRAGKRIEQATGYLPVEALGQVDVLKWKKFKFQAGNFISKEGESLPTLPRVQSYLSERDDNIVFVWFQFFESGYRV